MPGHETLKMPLPKSWTVNQLAPRNQRVREFRRLWRGDPAEAWFWAGPRGEPVEPESRGRGLPWLVRCRKSFDGVRGCGGAWKTPGTFVLGLGCQPIERKSWLPAERVPERDSNLRPLC